MTGDLVLSDNILWDWRVPKRIHKFDKFTNHGGGGIFHSNGLEVIINSEVWDLRTYKLLQTVPALDRTRILFNSTGDVFYTLPIHTGSRAVVLHQPTSFRTFDASDYSPIATIDIGRMISSLETGFHEHLIATVGTDQSGQTRRLDNACRFYKIGVKNSKWIADINDFLEDEENSYQYKDDDDEEDDESEPLSDVDGFVNGIERWGLHPSILSDDWTDDGSYHDSLQSESWDSSSDNERDGLFDDSPSTMTSTNEENHTDYDSESSETSVHHDLYFA
jgi:DDB1- and CUL4-associated factor 1